MAEEEAPGSPQSKPTQISALYNILASPRDGVVKTYAAAVDTATRYLPTQLSSRRRAGPPPLLICVRRRYGDDVYLTLPIDTPLQELRAACERSTGVPASLQRLFVEEEDRPTSSSGLVSVLRTTAANFTSRERVKDAVSEWVNFIFLPEAINREVRGRGLVSWAREHIWPHLQEPQPQHVVHATAVLLAGRRPRVELSHTASLQRLREAVEKQTGLPLDRQRLVVVQQAPQGRSAALFWAVARMLYVVGCAAAGAAAAGARWLLLGPSEGGQTITLKLQTGEGGVPVELALRHDLTLGQLQHMVQLRHGEGVNLQAVVLGGPP